MTTAPDSGPTAVVEMEVHLCPNCDTNTVPFRGWWCMECLHVKCHLAYEEALWNREEVAVDGRSRALQETVRP